MCKDAPVKSENVNMAISKYFSIIQVPKLFDPF